MLARHLCLLALAAGLPRVASAQAPTGVPDAGVDGGGDVAAAEEEADEEDDGPPTEAVVGIYVNAIRSVRLQENAFEVDFWIWFRWPEGGREIDPLSSFEVIGGDIESKSGEVREDLGDTSYAACRVVARIITFFDVREFPHDQHELAIVIEDTEHEDHELSFTPDPDNSRLDPDVRVPGFVIGAATTHVAAHRYLTNYGDITLPSNAESSYSRFELSIEIKRPGFGFAFKLLWAFWLSSLIALIALFIKPTNVDPRFGLGVGALFAAMANAFIISSALPETSDVTTADAVGMLSIAVIFFSILESIVSLWLFENGRERIAKRIDTIAFVAMTGAYVGLCALLVAV
jgi:hypothetical protein